MYYSYLSSHDVSAIACMSRRIGKDDVVYGYVIDMIKEEIRRQETIEDCFETQSRRAVFKDLLEARMPENADRNAIISSALTVAHTMVNDAKAADAACMQVTDENYYEKVDELVDMLSRYQPDDAEINRLARRMAKYGAVNETAEFAANRIDYLTRQAVAMHRLAKQNKLNAFNQSTTLTDAVNFVMANEAADRMYRLAKAGTAGEIIGGFIGMVIILAAIIGACVLAVVAVVEAIQISEVLGIAAILGILALCCSEKAQQFCDVAMEKTLDTSMDVAGTVAIKAVNLVTRDPNPDYVYL